MSRDKSLAALDVGEQFANPLAEIDELENLKELTRLSVYNILPRFLNTERREIREMQKGMVERSYAVRDSHYNLELIGAMIKKPSGERVMVIPTEREEVIESVLMRMAMNQGRDIEGLVGVVFTLSELKRELDDIGHCYDFNEIKEALFVLRGAMQNIYNSNGSAMISENYIGGLGLNESFSGYRKGTACYVQMNRYVSEQIRQGDLTIVNYRLINSIKRNPLAKYMLKRLVYDIQFQKPGTKLMEQSMIEMIVGAGCDIHDNMANNVRRFKRAIDTITKLGVITNTRTKPIKEGKFKLDEVLAFNVKSDILNEQRKNLELTQQLRLIR
jgi:hypothetical protein